jgi:putative cardiolipin synthase
MGLVIESATLARAISSGLDAGLARTAYEVRLNAAGELEWIEQTEAGVVRYTTEPKAGVGRRIGVSLLSILPIDWLL